jgi:hypothetical protein
MANGGHVVAGRPAACVARDDVTTDLPTLLIGLVIASRAVIACGQCAHGPVPVGKAGRSLFVGTIEFNLPMLAMEARNEQPKGA